MVHKPQPNPPIEWAYGVTTVPERKDKLLPQTLHSLCDAGFGDPHLFVDGCDDPLLYSAFGYKVSCRPNPPLSIVGNWVLGMWELYVRNPYAQRYAMFQDDILVVGNLREYLDHCEYPKNGYWNLYTHKENTAHTAGQSGWCLAMQKGLGALGLVFDRETLQTLLSARLLVNKPIAANKKMAVKSLDGGVSESMKQAKYKEYTHNPSLLQHCGLESSLQNKRYLPVKTFPGVGTDATTLLNV